MSEKGVALRRRGDTRRTCRHLAARHFAGSILIASRREKGGPRFAGEPTLRLSRNSFVTTAF